MTDREWQGVIERAIERTDPGGGFRLGRRQVRSRGDWLDRRTLVALQRVLRGIKCRLARASEPPAGAPQGARQLP